MESVSSLARKKSASDSFLESSEEEEEKGRHDVSDVWRALMGAAADEDVSFWRQWRRRANIVWREREVGRMDSEVLCCSLQAVYVEARDYIQEVGCVRGLRRGDERGEDSSPLKRQRY